MVDIVEIMDDSSDSSLSSSAARDRAGRDRGGTSAAGWRAPRLGPSDLKEALNSDDNDSCSDTSSCDGSSSGSSESSTDDIDSGDERCDSHNNRIDADEKESDDDSVASNSGMAIESKYGTENIKVADGVAFSSASSMFFSNIASGDADGKRDANARTAGSGAASSSGNRSMYGRSSTSSQQKASVDHRGNGKPISRVEKESNMNGGYVNDGDKKPKAKPTPAVNPYKRSSPSRSKIAISPAVNPYKRTPTKPSSSKDLLESNVYAAAKQPFNPYKVSTSKPVQSESPCSNPYATISSNGIGTSKTDLSQLSQDGSSYTGAGDSGIAQRQTSHQTATKSIGNSIAPHDHGKSEEHLPSNTTTTTPKPILIDPSLYKPPPFQQKSEPRLNTMTLQTVPKQSRRMIPVNQLFAPPISNFWTSKFHSFNQLQSELANTLVYSDDNVVVSAPTGAGKTCVFEMAMGRLFGGCGKIHGGKKIPNSRKIVYISPSKALCDERYNDWTTRLAKIDPSIECAVVTGDARCMSFRGVAGAHVILTTPEKWDSITRKWTDHLLLIGSVKLLMIDEVHLLGDESRGGCLEAIICRMKTVQRAAKAKQRLSDTCKPGSGGALEETLGMDMRIICVSATLPNISDIASFIDAHEAYNFDSSYRPVPLTTHVVGLGFIGKNQFLFDKNLGKEVPGLVHRFANKKPSLIFCHTKKQTEALAVELTSTCGSSGNDRDLIDLSKQTSLATLQRCLKRGIAYHHAGLEAENRNLVEKAFSRGLIKCLCATSTLAMGVNLPAHLVIIKGTKVWRGAGQGYQDIDSGTLLQMMGRAGRPGFDTSGTAVIMTDKKSKPAYERMSTGLEVVESKLLRNLVETLNTEISQQVINNVEEAIDWLKGTFFFIRVRKNPKHYGLFGKSESERESYLMSQCMQSLQNLHLSNVIELSDNGNHIRARRSSLVMSRHLVPFDSMKSIIELPHDSGPLQILQLLSEMNGLHFPVRRAEKSHLNGAHKMIKYKLDGPPSKVRIQTPAQKTFVLLQSAIGQHYLDDYTLRQEMSLVAENASRMLSAAEDFSVEESKHGKVALECMLMRRCLATSLWSGKDGVLNQVIGVGQKTTAKLAIHNIRTFEDLMAKSSSEIEQACGRASPFGQQLRAAVTKILQGRISLSARIEGLDSPGEDSILVCQLALDDSVNGRMSGTPNKNDGEKIVKYTLVVHTDRPGGALMFRPNIVEPGCYRIVCSPKFGRIYIRLVSNLVGLDASMILDGNDTVQISSFTLTPVKDQDSKKKKAKKDKQSSKKKTLYPSIMQHMVTGIEDLRVPKRTNSRKNLSNSVRTPSSSKSISFFGQTEKSDNVSEIDRTVVTPSPSMFESSARRTGQNSTSSAVKVPSERKRRESRTPITHEDGPALSRQPKRARSHQNTWQKEKKEQNVLQQRAFGSPKENPFSAFQFDPNDTEKQLEQQSQNNHQADPDFNRSIIPPSSRSPINSNTPVIHAQRRSRFLSGGRPQQRTPPKYKATSFVGSARRHKSATAHVRPQNQDLLRQKAEEQQSYAMALQESRTQEGLGNNRIQVANYGTNALSPNSRYGSRMQAPYHTPSNFNTYANHNPGLHRTVSKYNPHMPSHEDAWQIENFPNFDRADFIPHHNQVLDTFPSMNQPLPVEQNSRPFNEYEIADTGSFHGSSYQDNRSFSQQIHNKYANQEWNPLVERHAYGASFAQPSGSGILYNQRSGLSNTQHVNAPPFQFSQYQDEYQEAPIQSQNVLQMHSHNGNANDGVEHNEDPQGMIITVEGGNEGAQTKDGQNDTDFENAFFT